MTQATFLDSSHFCIFHKTFASLLILAVSFSTPGFAFEIRQERIQGDGVLVSRPHPEDMSILRTLRQNGIQTLEEYAGWLSENIRYRNDVGRDLWAPAIVTLNSKEGDCEDYAFLTAAVAKMLGHQTEILALVAPDKSGHAICVIEANGYYYWFDNSHFQKTQARSLPELARIIFQVYDSTHLLKLNRHKQTWEPAFRRIS